MRTLEEIAQEFQGYKVDVHNNLGYLLYMGMGTKANTKLALEYWKLAYDAGHAESSYHLCHAYGDTDRAEYSPKTALGYCEEAISRYKKETEVDKRILEQLRQYVSRLRQR